ncbi:hypothetical protein [Methanococcoides alaskense]|uniref:Heptaprenylglyceryl phosphate synthase n=1 Tax=Methanococcoides alaskense TaxID=325778 RepID=A0AA90TXD1_9EURY|nr:hypothetical protein [Methanococcoides alaskense]MDA0525474.1 hypothetical protein [Methanococcoides alaskense]MDR6221591.1 heptaprenylglyceryl phosphate synthase [Methanococcoides alaskense]
MIVLILLKEYLGTDYRDFVEIVEVMDSIKEEVDLDQVLLFTTLEKFMTRIDSAAFTILLNKKLNLFYSWGE